MKVSVCIPMYNEAAVIAGTARTLYEAMRAEFEDFEILFADDGSTDGCGDIVRALELPGVRVIGYTPNRGKGYAVRTALTASTGDVALFTDADLAYGTDVIAQAVKIFEESPETMLVVGSRNLSRDGYAGYTFLRRVMSKVYLKVLAICGGLKLSDSQCGFKSFRRDAIDTILPRCEVDRFAFDFEILLWADRLGMPIREMPVTILHHGESKVRPIRDSFRMLRDLSKMKRRIRRAAKAAKKEKK